MTTKLHEIAESIRSTPILFRTFQASSGGAEAVISSLARTEPRVEIGLTELIEIGRAKLFKVQDPARIDRNLRGNDDEDVRSASRLAFKSETDEAAIGALLDLKGVKVAVGSAILSWCFPDRWPVIDRHAWRALSEFGLLSGRPANLHFSAAEYAEFCEVVCAIAKCVGRRPQEIDTWLYSFAKCGLTAADVRFR